MSSSLRWDRSIQSGPMSRTGRGAGEREAAKPHAVRVEEVQFRARRVPAEGLDPQTAVRKGEEGLVRRQALRQVIPPVRPGVALESPTARGIVVRARPGFAVPVHLVVGDPQVRTGPAGDAGDPARPVEVREFVVVGRSVPYACPGGRIRHVLPPLPRTAAPRLKEDALGARDPRAEGGHVLALDGHEGRVPPVEVPLGQVFPRSSRPGRRATAGTRGGRRVRRRGRGKGVRRPRGANASRVRCRRDPAR